jgi:type I restriction enzyme M protein
VLLFTKGAETDRIWYYDMAHDGFSLDDKRQPTLENDIPDIVQCWQHRHDEGFQTERQERLAALRKEAAPLAAERLRLLGEINRLKFEKAIAPDGDEEAQAALEAAEADLAALQEQRAPIQAQIDQLTRQFWVTREQVAVNKYDLSASRYRNVEAEETYYGEPEVTMERLLELERVMAEEIRELEGLIE